MRERRQIIEQWRRGLSRALITLVKVQGSSYRQPGARLLLSSDGSYEGGISGGCLEADVVRKAAWLTRSGAAVERYSTTTDEAGEVPFGLGCGGVIDLLLEPAESPECKAVLEAMEASLSGRESVVVTWLPKATRRMMRAVFASDGTLAFASDALDGELLFEARVKYLVGASSDSDEVYVERLTPPQRMFVLGAGDDTKPLVSLAALLGWHVTVLDGRAHLARRERFPEASSVTTNIEAALQQVGADDAVVLMSHSYDQDRDALCSLLPLRPIYLGLLGSRGRSSLLLAEAAATLDWTLAACCELVSAPMGLDLGGEGPEAIALAVMAEAQACCMGKQTGRRKLSAEEVQHCLDDDRSRSYLQLHCGLSLA